MSGLSFAHYLRIFLKHHKKSDTIRKITLIEANDYLGGSIKSNVFDDNTVHEVGPRSVRMSGYKANNTVGLLEQMGLGDQILSVTPKKASGRERYVYREGKFWRVPTELALIFKKLPASETRLVSILMRDLRQGKMDLSKYPHNDPPLYDFIKFRFGAEAAEAIIDPVLRGISAGDCRHYSTRGFLGTSLDKEQKYGSFIKSVFKPPLQEFEKDDLFLSDFSSSEALKKLHADRAVAFNVRPGLQTLPVHLCNSLLNNNDDDVMAIYNRTRGISVKFNGDQIMDEDESQAPCTVVVETVDGDRVDLDCDHIVAALPANQLTTMLRSKDSIVGEPQMEALDFATKIPHCPVGCVTLEYQNLDIKQPELFGSFGFLTHSKAGSRLLGVSFDSAVFPGHDSRPDRFRLTCMMGGAWAEEVFGTSSMDSVSGAQMEQIALEEVSKLLDLNDEPVRVSSYMWKTGIAQYRPGHVAQVAAMREKMKSLNLPVTLLGQSYDGVAVNDVLYSARIAADKFAKSL